MVKAAYKEITSALETDDDRIEKTANDDSPSKKPYEYLDVNGYHAIDVLWSTAVVHATAFTNYYQSPGYFEIAGPPPDFASIII